MPDNLFPGFYAGCCPFRSKVGSSAFWLLGRLGSSPHISGCIAVLTIGPADQARRHQAASRGVAVVRQVFAPSANVV